jgi:hypothetical protein
MMFLSPSAAAAAKPLNGIPVLSNFAFVTAASAIFAATLTYSDLCCRC